MSTTATELSADEATQPAAADTMDKADAAAPLPSVGAEEDDLTTSPETEVLTEMPTPLQVIDPNAVVVGLTVCIASHHWVCSTCEEDLPSAAYLSATEGTKCHHEIRMCARCWDEWLTTQVASNNASDILCAECNNVLEQSDIKALASQEVFDRYLNAELRAVLSSDPNFHYCTAASCDSGQVHDGEDIFTCVTCQHKVCMSCNVALHTGETCEAYQARIMRETAEHEARLKREAAIEAARTDKEKAVEMTRKEKEEEDAERARKAKEEEERQARERRDLEEAKSTVTLKRDTKVCPGCTRFVQKVE